MPIVNYTFQDAEGNGITSVVSFAIQAPPVEIGTVLVLEKVVTSTPASDGTGSITLAGGNYIVTIAANPESNFTIGVPSTGGPYRIEDITTDVTVTTPSTTYITKSTLTTKGDLISATAASTPSRLGVGTNGQVLSADSAEATGLKWAAAGTGTVTSVSVTTANGVSGTVATATTTPAISLTLGAITPTTVNAVTLSGASTPSLSVTGTTAVSGTNTGDNAANTSIAATKLDDFTAPDDNTDLNAGTTAHGLLVKATAPASGLLNVVGIGNTETAYTNKALFDTTNPAALGSAGPGTQLVAARRDHIHAMPTAADVGASATSHYHTESIIVAAGDETTAITAGTAKVSFRMPYAFTLTAVRASLVTAQTSGNIFTVDIHEAGTTILSVKLTVDNGELTSTTAATAPTISDAALADDALITVDVDQIGDSTAKGLKITLIGHQ